MKNLIIFFLLMTVCLAPMAQDSVITEPLDSSLAVSENSKELIQSKADSLRIVDSLEQVMIRQKIDELSAANRQEKVKLQAELDSIKEHKAERDLRVKQQIDSLRASTTGVPLIFELDTLFFLYAKLGPLSPSERCSRIVKKLDELTDLTDFDPSSVELFNADGSIDLLYNDHIILTLTQQDAFWSDQELTQLAENVKQTLSNAVLKARDDKSLYRILLRIALILLVALILYAMVKLMNTGFSRLVRLTARTGDRYMRGIKLGQYEFLSAEQEMRWALWMLNVLKWLVILLVIYLALPVIFSIFPSTEGIAKMLFGYVWRPIVGMFKGLIGFIPELISITVIIAVTRYLVRFLKFLSNEVLEGKLVIPGFYADWAMPTYNLLRILIWAFSFIIIFPYLPGSDSPVFQGVSVFLGLLISLGSSSAIGNIIAGLVITYMRPFKIGDRVKIGEITGDVMAKTMLVTRLRTTKNEDVSIPNAAILSGSTINYSSGALEQGLILHTTVTIGYDVPWNKVHELLVKAALACELVKNEPAPFILQTSLDDFYVSYQLNAYTDHPGKSALIYSEIHKNIQDVFNEGGVEILSPHYRAQRDGSIMTVPPDYLPPGYQAPPFQVKLTKDE